MGELDRHIQLQLLRRERLINRGAIYDPQGLGEIEEIRLSIDCRKSRLRERRQKRRRASVENWRLRPVHVDGDVVDLQSRHRGEDVLHGVHRVFAFAQLGAPLAPRHFAHVRANPGQSRAVSAPKQNSLFRGRGLEGDFALHAEVEADSLQRRGPGERLSAHLASASSSNFSRRRIMPANLNKAADARRDSR